MKYLQILSLSISFFSGVILGKEARLNPKTTVIIFDIDDVLIEKSFFLNCMAQLKHISGYTKSSDGFKDRLEDTTGKTINGITFQLLYHGMKNKFFAKYVSRLLYRISISRKFIEGTEKICRYLKHVKGYTIVFATNKDRIEYDIVAKTLGEKFSSLPELTFVAHNANSPHLLKQIKSFSQLWNTPESYKELAKQALTIEPTQIILHVPHKKPDIEYFEYVKKHLGDDKNLIFIDDRSSNINSFHSLESKHKTSHHGIVFKDAQQLAEELIFLGILSETEDRELLDGIRYKNFIGKVRSKKRRAVKKMRAIAEVIRN